MAAKAVDSTAGIRHMPSFPDQIVVQLFNTPEDLLAFHSPLLVLSILDCMAFPPTFGVLFADLIGQAAVPKV
jgi:hypothetical protein